MLVFLSGGSGDSPNPPPGAPAAPSGPAGPAPPAGGPGLMDGMMDFIVDCFNKFLMFMWINFIKLCFKSIKLFFKAIT